MYSRITVTLVWYPTTAREAAWQMGPFPIAATRDAPVAPGARFPIILLSHGGGGSPLNHRDLAARLARDGFIVVAPTHGGDSAGSPKSSRPLVNRVRQARKALDAVLTNLRFSERADAARIGMVGFSAGGTTTLLLAGATPDFERFAAYCRRHPDDPGACSRLGDTRSGAPEWKPIQRIPFKAIALIDPLAAMFTTKGLVGVDMPVLLYRPRIDDYLKGDGNAAVLAAGLPRPPRQAFAPGRHWVFIDPCPPALANDLPAICKDAPDVDRAAVHREIETEISDCLRNHL